MYKRNEEFVLRQIGGEFFMIPTGRAVSRVSGMVTVSETSAFIWDLLADEKSLEDLVSATTDTYEVPAPTAERDIRQLLAKLSSLGMLVMG